MINRLNCVLTTWSTLFSCRCPKQGFYHSLKKYHPGGGERAQGTDWLRLHNPPSSSITTAKDQVYIWNSAYNLLYSYFPVGNYLEKVGNSFSTTHSGLVDFWSLCCCGSEHSLGDSSLRIPLMSTLIRIAL